MKNFLFVFFIIVFLFLFSCSPYEKPLKIVHLTDIHVTPNSVNEDYFLKVIDDINSLKPDFVVITGDLTSLGSDSELINVKKLLDELTVPYYTIPGNHETNWSESTGLTFKKLWGNDRFLFKHGKYLFIGFNTGPYMKMGDGHVKQEDLQWIKRELGKEENQGFELISLAHYPLSEGLDNWPDVVDLLKEFNCKLALCGHGHNIELFNFDGIPGIMGRALKMRGDNNPGYNLVELKNDSLYYFEMIVGKDKNKPIIKFDLDNPTIINDIKISKIPNYSINDIYSNVKVEYQLNDTASIFTGPCLVNDSILIYANSLGYVKGVDIYNDDILWQNRYGEAIYSTPVSNDKIVAFGTVNGEIIGLNGLNGNEEWRVEIDNPVIAEGILEKNYLYLGTGNSGFYKIDMKTGDVLWRFKNIDGMVQGVPALGKSEVVFGAWDTYLYCLNKNNGKLLWKWNNGNSVKFFSPGNIAPLISNGKVFIVAPDRYMTAIDLKTGKELWRTNRHMVRESMGGSINGEKVFAKLMNDSIIALSTKTMYPKILWSVDIKSGYDHNPCPIAANEKWIATGNKNGVVSLLNCENGNIVWQCKVGNSSVNKLLIDKMGNVWVSLIEGKIFKLKYIVCN